MGAVTQRRSIAKKSITSTPVVVPIPWTPLDSGILAAWYDPSDDANLIFSGAEIIGATDLSGNGLNMGITGVGTLLRGTINGVQSIAHNSENRALSRAAFTAAGGYFCTFDSDVDTGYMPLAAGNNTTHYDAFALSGNASTLTASGVTRANLYADGVALAALPTRGQIYTAFTGKRILYAQTDLPGAWTAISPFGYNNLAIYALSGQEGEVIFLTSVPITAMRQKFEGYLAHKWGMAGNLDAAHPYKITAPTV